VPFRASLRSEIPPCASSATFAPAGPAYAALQSDGTACEIAGDIFGDFRITDRLRHTPENCSRRSFPPTCSPSASTTGSTLRKAAGVRRRNPCCSSRPPARSKIPAIRSRFRKEWPARKSITMRAGGRHRPALQKRFPRQCARLRARLYLRERRVGTGLGNAKPWGGGQWCQAKSFDTFCPLGPVLVTKSEIPDPNDLQIRSVLKRPGDAGLEYGRHDLRRADPHRVPERQQNAFARHRHPHRHAARSRFRAHAAGVHAARRHHHDRDRKKSERSPTRWCWNDFRSPAVRGRQSRTGDSRPSSRSPPPVADRRYWPNLAPVAPVSDWRCCHRTGYRVH